MAEQRNEGEGSQSAAREYEERTKQYLKEANIQSKAEQAAESLESEEGDALREAERKGKEKAREEDPNVRR